MSDNTPDTLIAKFSSLCTTSHQHDPDLVHTVQMIMHTIGDDQDACAAVHALPFHLRNIFFCVANSIETDGCIENVRLFVEPEEEMRQMPDDNQLSLPTVAQSLSSMGCFFARIGSGVVSSVAIPRYGFGWLVGHTPQNVDTFVGEV